MLDHAKSDVPKIAMCKMRAEKYRERGESLVIESRLGHSLSVLDKTTRDRLKVWFDICYLMAKQGLSFSKYLSLLELETSPTLGCLIEILRDWASEASPTLGCSIEISRDIYMYVGMSVYLSYVKLTA